MSFWWVLYEQTVDKHNNEHQKDLDTIPSRWDYHLYDAVWAWALVLNKVTMVDNTRGNTEFGNNCFSKAALYEFYMLDFQGSSGRIHFNVNTGFVDCTANMYQTISRNERLLAYSNGTETLTVHNFITIPDRKRTVGLLPIGMVGFFLATHCALLVTVVMIHIFIFLPVLN